MQTAASAKRGRADSAKQKKKKKKRKKAASPAAAASGGSFVPFDYSDESALVAANARFDRKAASNPFLAMKRKGKTGAKGKKRGKAKRGS